MWLFGDTIYGKVYPNRTRETMSFIRNSILIQINNTFEGFISYPSDINNPDLVDPTKAIRINRSNAELLMRAIKVATATIMVATTKDIYILSGTFQTYPDFTIDVYYRPLGIKHPPITQQVAAYNGLCYGMAADGIRAWDANGQDISISFPNIDSIFQGNTSPGELSVFTPGLSPGNYSYPIAIAGDKLYVNLQQFVGIFDITRKYWTTFSQPGLGGGTGYNFATALASLPGGGITGAFSGTRSQYDFNKYSVQTIDGAPIQFQHYSVKHCNNQPLNRKDGLTFKIRLKTGVGENLTIQVKTDDGVITNLGAVTAPGITPLYESREQILDASILPISQWYQFIFTGNFTQLEIVSYSLHYEARPALLTHLILRYSNFGTASKKRLRTWPHVIDTVGNPVTFTPAVDNVPLAPETFTSNYRKTYVYKFTTDAFGIDYGGVFHGGPFEYWGQGAETGGISEVAGQPEIVQVLPQGVRFDQVGPEELARYGKVMQFDIRLLSEGSLIPWRMYFNDNTLCEGKLATRIGEEWSYNISVPKGISGHILRIELGPTDFDFHRFYIRVLVARSGNDTQNEWLLLGARK